MMQAQRAEDWLSAHRRRAAEFPHFSIRAREQASHPAIHVPPIRVHMRKLPVIAADKLDRRALESVTIQTAVTFEDAQSTRIQAEIRELWKQIVPREVFDHYQVTSLTDVFEIGGSSL
jgi:exonuclease I